MNSIKNLSIKGYKKFTDLNVVFNDHMNIIVGENEAGKSTILDALNTVLNQQYRNADKSILRDLFNIQMVNTFKENPTINNLPKIIIEVELELDATSKNAIYFYGENYGKIESQDAKYGIRFECKYNEILGSGMEDSIMDGKIPYEYYDLTWTTYANNQYQMVRRPLGFITIDTTSNYSPSFNYYNKTLFTSRYNDSVRLKAKNDFRTKLEEAFDSTQLPMLDDDRKFGIDTKKVILENILSVYEDSVALENRGSGMESLIKTEIALNKTSGIDVILIEEPENHLSFSTLRKMLQSISDRQKDSQIIIATHSNMIASSLNLNNVLWITENGVKSLSEVNVNVADFFAKADDNSFLQLLLSKKAVLVEGPTEYLLFPYFYKQATSRTIQDDNITVISCNGISYNNYLEIADKTKKKIAVITDNDKSQEKIDESNEFNKKHNLQHVFMAASTDNWTWEICIYNANKGLMEKMIHVKKDAQYLFHGEFYGAVQGKMLNNKVETAYQMMKSGNKFTIPDQVKAAIVWLGE